MSDWKSKLPDLQEVWSMTVKLATDVKASVTEIARDYKEKHPDEPVQAEPEKPAKEKSTKEKVVEKRESEVTSDDKTEVKK